MQEDVVKMKETEIGELPLSWSVKKIGDLYESQYGYTESATEENTGVKFLRITDISDRGFVQWPTVPFCEINEEDYKKYELKEGDLLVARIGATTGKTCVISSNGRTSVFASYLIRLERKNNEIDPKFGFFFTQSGLYWDQINANKHGKLKKGVSATLLRSLDIPLPPLPEQQKIASILSTVQDAIEQTEAVIQATRELKKSMMKHLFTYGPVPVDQTDQVELKETEFSTVNCEWKKYSLEDLTDIQYGIQAAVSNNKDPDIGIQILTNSNIDIRGYIDYSDQKYYDLEQEKKQDRYILKKGDVLFNWRSGSRRHVGKVAFFNEAKKITHSSFILRIRDNNKIVATKFIYFYMDYLRRVQQFFYKKHDFMINAKFNKSHTSKIPVYLPDKSIQIQIVNSLTAIENKIDQERDLKLSLETLFNSLLESLMSAKIRVV